MDEEDFSDNSLMDTNPKPNFRKRELHHSSSSSSENHSHDEVSAVPLNAPKKKKGTDTVTQGEVEDDGIGEGSGGSQAGTEVDLGGDGGEELNGSGFLESSDEEGEESEVEEPDLLIAIKSEAVAESGGWVDGKLTKKRDKRIQNQERKNEQNIRGIKERLIDNIFGERENEGNGEENKMIVSIENGQGTKLNIENATIMQVTTILGDKIHAKDILEVRINKRKQRATVKVNCSNICNVKSKKFLEEIEQKEEVDMKIWDQARWRLTKITRSSIGVIKNVPLDEDLAGIKWYLNEIGKVGVREVRQMGKYAVSIQFDGPLPDKVMLPCSAFPFRVEAYNPGPVRCMKCYVYGHTASTCIGPMRCFKCGGEKHLARACVSSTPKCPNCGGEHAPTWHKCPTTIKKKEEKNKALEEKRFEREEHTRIAFTSLWGQDFPSLVPKANMSSIPSDYIKATPQIGNISAEFEARILKRVDDLLDSRLGDLEKRMEALFEKLADRVVGLFETFTVPSPGQVKNGLDEGSILEKIDSRLGGFFGGVDKAFLSIENQISKLENIAPFMKLKAKGK